MPFDQKAFNQFVLDRGIVGIFDEAITLKSGRKSHWYANWRGLLSYVLAVRRVCDFVLDFVESLDLQPDCFYGVPEGATKLGVVCNVLAPWHNGKTPAEGAILPLPMGRAKPKDHGHPKDRFFVGAPTGKVVVLEDVTTTGGSLLDTLAALRELDEVEILCAIGLTNRMEKRDDGTTVHDAVLATGVEYHHMSSALDLLPTVLRKQNVKKHVADFIVAEFDQVGIRPLEL